MFLRTVKSILIGVVVHCIYINAGLGQQVAQINLHYLDSVEKSTRIYLCENILVYPDKHEKKKIAQDKLLVGFLNKLFSPDINREKLYNTLGDLKKVKIGKTEKINGVIKEDDIIISGNYLRIELAVESIGNAIYRKNCDIITKTNGRCDPSEWRVPDYKLLTEAFVAEFNFLIRVWDNRYLNRTDLNLMNIRAVSAAYPDYKFNIPDSGNSDWINKIYLKQYIRDSAGYYQFFEAPKDFAALIKNERTDVIRSLLFSPNYFYAVNAMEALIYLSRINKVVLDDAIKKKMDLLKQERFPITVQKTTDLFGTYEGYKSLGMSEEQVVQKYRNTFQSK